MFRERIDQTPFTTEEADYYFRHITSDSTYAGDKSFLATARAMLADRIPEGKSLTLYTRPMNLTGAELGDASDSSIATAFLGDWPSVENALVVMELTCADTVDRILGAVRTWAEMSDGKWECVERVEALFRKSFPLNCYICRETGTAILLTDRLSLRKWHSIQVVLFRCLPWFFPEDKPITEGEKELARALSKDSSAEYLSILRKEAAKYDFEKSRIKRLLTGFETTYERRRIENCKAEIERKRRQIKDYNDTISNMLTELRKQNIALLGSIAAMEQRKDESELMDYFLADRNLVIESCEDGQLRFFVKGYLENYDPDEACACIDNDSSYVTSGRSDGKISVDDMRRLMHAVFTDGKIRIRVCAAYTFDIGDSISVVPQSNKRYPAEFSTYLPNPHIQGYGCMGAYRKIINDLLLDGDYVGAVVQCEASCNSLNWGDYAVMGNFMDRMYYDDTQCFELPDGSCVNQREAVKWLNEQEEQK